MSHYLLLFDQCIIWAPWSVNPAVACRRQSASNSRLNHFDVQEQAFERVGGNETIQTDVRLIAATHRDLKAWSEDGKFRPDLFYRLGVFTIHLPPLRERVEDLPLLTQPLPAPG